MEDRCKDVATDHTERLFRAVLDANATAPLGVGVCEELLPHCEAARAERFFSVPEPEEEEEEREGDDETVVAGEHVARGVAEEITEDREL